MRVQDVMTRGVETIDDQSSAESAFFSMRAKGIHHLVVKKGSVLVGVISQRDLGLAEQDEFRQTRRVSDLMKSHVVTVGPEASVRQAANLMRGRSIGCLPVVQEGARKKLVGIVTVSDLLELLGRGVDRPASGKRVNLKTRGPRMDTKVKRMQ
jgi:acetoin utilization protein AcuB